MSVRKFGGKVSATATSARRADLRRSHRMIRKEYVKVSASTTVDDVADEYSLSTAVMVPVALLPTTAADTVDLPNSEYRSEPPPLPHTRIPRAIGQVE